MFFKSQNLENIWPYLSTENVILHNVFRKVGLLMIHLSSPRVNKVLHLLSNHTITTWADVFSTPEVEPRSTQIESS